ncbi:MAG: hypothetical protein ABI207_08810 [Crocinitomicaceae bacterium]
MRIVENKLQKEEGIMAVFGTNEELVATIGEGLKKCKTEPLELAEYETLLNQARELHERVLLIRHKAFEILSKKEEITQKPVEKIEEIKESEPEEVNFAFSLFEEPKQEEEKQTPTPEPISIPEPIVEKPIEAEIKTPEIKIPEIKHVDSFSIQDKKDTLADSYSQTNEEKNLASSHQKNAIASLSNAFSLNDRIRFVKNLFEGNSDTFNLTVKEIDTLNNKQEANDKLNQLIQIYSWNKENEDFILFSSFIDRRFL